MVKCMIKYLGKSKFRSNSKELYQSHFCVTDDKGNCNTYSLFISEELYNKLKISDTDKPCKLISGINYRGLTLIDLEINN